MAYTQKKYARINWKNRPSTATPLGETNLNKMDVFLNEVDNALITMEAAKLNILTANSMIASITFDKDQGIMTVRQLDGTEFTFDWNVEKIPVSFTLSEKGVLTMTTQDGTQFTANIADLITNYSFGASATISMIVVKNQNTGVNRVSAEVKRGSLTEEHLNLEYREEIVKYRNEAHDAASDSLIYSKDSKRWAVGDEEYEGSDTDNAKYYKEQAESFSQLTLENADSAKEYSDAAKKQADISTQNANNTAADRTAVESAKQEVEDMVSSIPEDYTALDQHVQDLDNGLNTKAPAIRLEATVQNGGPTELLMPGDSGLQGLTVYGKSTQRTTTGTQIITNKRYGKNHEVGGVTFKIFEDGSVYINGTNITDAEVNTVLFTKNDLKDIGGLEDGQYFLSGNIKGSNVILQFWESPANSKKDNGDGVIVNFTDSGQDYNVAVVVKPGTSVNNVTLYPMFNKGETALPFEPYTGGMPAPNPNYPQEIESVGEEVGIRCGGKNWAIKDKFKEANVNKIAFLEAGKYTISVRAEQLSNKNKWGFNLELGVNAVNNKDGNTLAASNDQSFGTDFHKTFVMKERGWVSFNGYSPERYTVMIVLGNEKAPYEPYHEPSTAILPTPNGLPGIPVTSGGNYTAPDGQQWVCDTIEWDRVSGQREYVKRVSTIKAIPIDSPQDNTETKWSMRLHIFDSISNILGPFDDFIICENIQVVEQAKEQTYNYPVMSPYRHQENLELRYWMPKSQYPTVDDAIVAATGNVLYPCVPIRTPLTADQIKALESLHTFSPTSIISNDQGADMQVIYAADTKAYIDSKIDALSKTILDAVGGK